jgi:raffinose/stachyose/melibiose transport system permease protein
VALDTPAREAAIPAPTPAATRTSRRRGGRGVVGSRRSTVVLAVVPAFVLVGVFLVLPLAQAVRLSVSSWYGVGPATYTGSQNYRDAIHGGIVSTLWLTAKFALLSTIGIMVLATLMAAVVSARVKGARFYRVVWFLPGIAPVTAVALFWSTAFQPGTGAVNVVMGAVGLGRSHTWLADASKSIYPPIFVTIWASVGFAFLLVLGAMEQIPVSVYEAARLDGARAVRTLFSITLPLVRPVLVVTTLLEFIWSFNGFSVLWAMTEGGPGFSTSILPVQVYRQAFQLTNFGLASAMAVIGGGVLVVIGAISLRFSRSRQLGAAA